MTTQTSAYGGPDQASLPVFRLLLGVQALATIVFGVIPLALPETFASVTGYSGDDAYHLSRSPAPRPPATSSPPSSRSWAGGAGRTCGSPWPQP